MKFSTLLLTFLFATTSFGQDKQAYEIFDAKGTKTSYEKIIKTALKNKIVLFGEYHNNPIVHWLQYEFTKDLFAKKGLVLGAEMFETDNQNQLNDYLSGKINQKVLDSTARLWKNYKTDYKPLVDFAKDKKISFIATNIPRKYASMVYKKGLEELQTISFEEKKLMAPLPIEFNGELPGYKEMLKMEGNHAGDKMPKAQAIKDATMAWFILKNLKENYIFIHYNGTYHSDNFEGISWYIKEHNPEVSIMTIATVEQKDVKDLEKENLGKADFIIVVDEDMTKTH
ncbi:ChaN family lipoprotein [Flavobacterium sp.]|jgi:uncharacterized iron-regulated protein|uniref:ChaN family lipoprotein n=1 Tax=Flavobacterium sp. TaxID=239 RepID=UPI0037C18E09